MIGTPTSIVMLCPTPMALWLQVSAWLKDCLLIVMAIPAPTLVKPTWTPRPVIVSPRMPKGSTHAPSRYAGLVEQADEEVAALVGGAAKAEIDVGAQRRGADARVVEGHGEVVEGRDVGEVQRGVGVEAREVPAVILVLALDAAQDDRAVVEDHDEGFELGPCPTSACFARWRWDQHTVKDLGESRHHLRGLHEAMSLSVEELARLAEFERLRHQRGVRHL